MRHWYVFAFAIILVSCSGDNNSEPEIQFWHFFSEPHQQRVLDSLVNAFNNEHNCKVVPTALSWTDGITKLQLAFNSGTQPDVVHIGLDWLPAFSVKGLLADLDTTGNVVASAPYSKLWVMNARALFIDTTSNNVVGLCQSDPHNVLKRVLPFVWQVGAPEFYTTFPVSETMDDKLVDALWKLRELVETSVIDHSKKLDVAFLRGSVSRVYSGPWLAEAINNAQKPFDITPTASILNADVVAVAHSSNHKHLSQIFISWLTNYSIAKTFCLEVPDAGFPYSDSLFADATFASSPSARAFIETLRLSKPLPYSHALVSIEPEAEQLIERCYRASSRQEVATLVNDTRQKIQAIESQSRR